jgi:hypothetical protein
MTPPEVIRFRPFLDRFAWHVVHPEKGHSSYRLEYTNASFPHSLICLPWQWSITRRNRELGLYIVGFVLKELGHHPTTPLTIPQYVAFQPDAEVLVSHIIAPKIWLTTYIQHHSFNPTTLRNAARLLQISPNDVYTTLKTQPSHLANQIHEWLLFQTGRPWFVPPECFGLVPCDRW